MSLKAKAQFYRQLARLIGSGFHLDRSVELLLSQNPTPAVRQFLERVKTGLIRGGGLATALEEASATALEVQMLRAGERTGRLDDSCTHLAEAFEAEASSQAAARSALIYPLILANAGALVPVLSNYLTASLTGTTFSLGRAMATRLVILWLLTAVTWWVWRTIRAKVSSSVLADRLARSIPWAGKVRDHWTLGRFCQVFHAALSAGIRVADVTRMAGSAAQSKLMEVASERAASVVDAGEPLSEALEAGGSSAFPKVFVDSIHAAEAAGTVDLEMKRWSQTETEFAIGAQKRAAEMLPKVLYFSVVAYVGWSIISFFASYYGQILKMSTGGL
ncbi:MAG: type II secretion system F family protein [Verrucomicrobiaceae bacterium]|nr:type II secretion system F family protein [Verrucomicrobiaceae bacterium]